MKQRLFHIGIAAIILMVIAVAARGFLQSRPAKQIPVKSMNSWQDADAPLGFPVNQTPPPFDARFIQLSAFERLQIPTAPHLTEAMGTESGALTYNAQPFWSDNPKRGGHHSGDDLNGIGGMNTDLGDPVYAIGNGLVVYRGEPSPGWGNVLVLAHRMTSGDILLSMYAHLDQIHTAYGDIIPRGKVLGTVGTANLNYPAHLHFEMLDSTGVYIGPGYLKKSRDRLDPNATLRQYSGLEASSLYSPALATVLNEQLANLRQNILIQTKKDQ